MRDPEEILAGILPLILILASILTWLSSFLLLFLYRRSVIRMMGQRIRGASVSLPDTPQPEVEHPENAPSISFIPFQRLPTTSSTNADRLFWTLRTAPLNATYIYLIAGLGYALAMATFWLVSFSAKSNLIMFLVLLLRYSWPTVITIYLLLSTNKFSRFKILSLYFIVALTIMIISAFPDWPVIWALLSDWGFEGLKAFIVLIAFVNRRTKTVAPLVMTISVFAAAGIVLALLYGINPLIAFLDSGHWISSIILTISRLFGPTAIVPISLFFLALLGMIFLGTIGWAMSKIIKYLYLSKRISDQSLLIDSIWFLLAIIQSIEFVFENPWWTLFGLVSFAIYKIVAGIAFSFYKKRSGSPEKAPQLLILRVFSLGEKSESLYNMLARAWRYAGNLLFITGPDLVTATVEPHDFLDYLSGRLGSRFIDGKDTLQRSLDKMDHVPDPDGRFRIQDFFCYDDTWKMVLSRLVDECEVILMDLRSFSSKNAGCKFEIEELINHISTEQVIFVIDKSTDENFMQQTMTTAWETMHPASPNRASSGKLNIFEYTGKRSGEFQNLLHAISVAANSTKQSLEVI